MAKKEKAPLTFEELAREKERKENKGKLFKRTFLKAFALFAAFAIIYFTVMIAFVPEVIYKEETFVVSNGSAPAGNNATPASANVTPAPTPADNGGNTAPANNGGSNDATPADNGNGGSDNNAAPAEDDVLTVFNEAINKVKTEASAITHTRGGSKTVDGVDPVDASSKLPMLLSKSFANNVINLAMNANGVKDKNEVIGSADFPVKEQTYSSQLTADDVVSATKNGNTITIVIKDDELGEADNGHCQKAMDVIKAETIMANIPGPVATIVQVTGAKTSAKNGTIVVTLDDNGHVVSADYSFNWDIELFGNNLDAIVHLASEEHYTMTY